LLHCLQHALGQRSTAARDVFGLYGHGRISRLVAGLGFEPAMWELYTDVRCAAFPPRSLAS
jgi:hypothetical protein